MLFPQAPAAEAQGIHGGYAYTERICQEYGQQPRHYQVRDEMAGSDWRSGGGWAIVLEGSARVVDTRIFTFNAGFAQPSWRYTNSAGGLVTGRVLTDNSESAFVGWSGLVQMNVNGSETDIVWIDHDGDGAITDADKVRGPSNNQYEILLFTEVGSTAVVGGRYIRWANMQWCRQG